MKEQDTHKAAKLDSIHLLLWLIKDTLWVMGFTYATVTMIIPTVGYTLYILFKNYKNKDYFVLYIAILFWLLGNSAWILNDFFFQNKYNAVCYIFFIAGIIITLWYILKNKNVGK